MTSWDNPVESSSFLGQLDDCDITIVEASFGYDNRKAFDPNLQMFFTIRNDDKPENEPLEQSFGCGTGWDTNSAGTEAAHEAGMPHRFHGSTGYGEWLKGAVNCGAALPMAERGEIWESKGWAGTRWHVELQSHKAKFADGERTWERLVPTKFLGVEGDTTVVAKAAAEVSPKVRGQLAVLAKKSDTYDEFVEQAFELAEVVEDREAQKLVEDPVFYETARSEEPS